MLSPNRKATRSSLACLACRSRHVKCDGTTPRCGRCVETGKECEYTQSRRGGLDRAALAARRKKLALMGPPKGIAEPAQTLTDPIANEGFQSQCDFTVGVPIGGPASAITDIDPLLHNDAVDESSTTQVPSTNQSPSPANNIWDDHLVELYFNTFHKSHPFVLPRQHLSRLYQESHRSQNLYTLIALVQLIGKLYGSTELSKDLREIVEAQLSQASPSDPFTVQCHLLYSIVLFWFGFKANAQTERNAAVQLAIDMGMWKNKFAAEHGYCDPVLEESWRRTWWTVYVIDAYFAGTLGTMNMAALEVESTVDLPCEESEYETGLIPEPKSLHDFDCREFAADDVSFSSFAYLVGAVRCAATAIMSTPKGPVDLTSLHIIQVADSMIEAWLLLLPPDRKTAMRENGEVDELMFQAHLLVHVAIVGLHRPFSDLKFNSIEGVSSCAREPPTETPRSELVNTHTTRVLRSAEAQIRFLTLPVRPVNHTPFTTCMVSEGALALLSACTFHLTGKKLATARDQIRMIIGCLKALGQLWPRAAMNVQEIQKIARHVLNLEPKVSDSSSLGSSSIPSLSNGEGRSSSEGAGLSDDAFSICENIDNLCSWFNYENATSDFSWWAASD